MIRLFYDEKFKNEVNCRYFNLRTNALSDETVFGMIDSMYNEVKNAQVKHFQKWKILGQNVGAPEIGTQPATYEGEVEKLKDWIATRFNWLDKNMLGKCTTVNSQEFADNSLFKIYPNPANNVVNILSGETMAALQIFDLTGKTIYTNQNVNAELAHVDVSTFPPGIYILKISNKNGVSTTEKIVVN
jgi:hypothetical protein